ncbi:helix-turn-helix transcriptional regulator [Streptomyces sp. NPDC006208]|uniref:response regulator transcription factor n=1 Tax=Streptomyces sp. NPDC006208 TaxID=3156734 RepID=UPI0033AC5400
MNHNTTEPANSPGGLTRWEKGSVRRIVREALIEHADGRDLQLTIADVDGLSRAAVGAITTRDIVVPPSTLYVTPMQRECLLGIALGETAKETGRRLHVTENTIKTHRQKLFARIKVKTSGQAVTKGLALGIISLRSGQAGV